MGIHCTHHSNTLQTETLLEQIFSGELVATLAIQAVRQSVEIRHIYHECIEDKQF